MKGQLEGFPEEVIQWMCDQQLKQGNIISRTVFEKNVEADKKNGGFDWGEVDTQIGDPFFCAEVIRIKNFDLFFMEFPKQCNNANTEKTDEKCNTELDLTEILKDVPKGTKFYSTIFGEVEFDKIVDSETAYPIKFKSSCGISGSVTKRGLHEDNFKDGECTLFPSKENKDWSSYKYEKTDYPIDTPMMCSDDNYTWYVLRYYAGDGYVFILGSKSANKNKTIKFKYTIPVTEFDFINGCRKSE